jgi:methylated-DNA-[protein]-cysteine S-methyltransferase
MLQDKKSYYIASALGTLCISATDRNLLSIAFLENESEHAATAGVKPKVVQLFERQLTEYLHGKRKQFDVAYELRGTDFQISIWQKLNDIPFGKTISYGKMAALLGDVKKVRAVANAIGKNPLPILIPCHRVVGMQGQLTGYIGGLARKKVLIDTEHQRQLNIFA